MKPLFLLISLCMMIGSHGLAIAQSIRNYPSASSQCLTPFFKEELLFDLENNSKFCLSAKPTLNFALKDQAKPGGSSPSQKPLFEPIDQKNAQNNNSLLENRLFLETAADNNPQAITTHKLNYFLPLSYNNNPNLNPQNANGIGVGSADSLDHLEAKFQVSFKAPIFEFQELFFSKLYFAFTAQSYWQVYNQDNSAPFRETNYEPEIMWTIPFKINLLDNEFNVAALGLSHQSNGKNIPLSRSWNRIYASFEWESGDWVFQFKPWYRIPEQVKASPDETSGDDNPDIEKYLGHFELRAYLRGHRNAVAMMVRNNLRSDNKGALQIDWNFPTRYPFKPYVQLFVGYGESLIDYNVVTRRLSMGILLKEWL